jgi:hypothetical protein
LRARDAGVLLPNQFHLAERAELIIRASAKTGIDGLIDEATGYQEIREADALQVKFKTYLSEELREWTRTFPREFFIIFID